MAVFVITEWRTILDKRNKPPMGMAHNSNPLSAVFGGGAQQAYNPNPSALQNNTAMVNNAYAQNQAAFQHQQMMMNQYNQARMPKPFRIHGKEMELVEFVETLYPEDCAERTYLLLKLQEKTDE